MTIFAYALIRAASQSATPAEREKLERLAQKADQGDKEAQARFRLLILDLIINAQEAV